MSVNPDNLRTYTDAELLKIARAGYANALQALSLGIGDRNARRADLEKYERQIEYLEAKIARGKRTHGGRTALGRYGRPR